MKIVFDENPNRTVVVIQSKSDRSSGSMWLGTQFNEMSISMTVDEAKLLSPIISRFIETGSIEE